MDRIFDIHDTGTISRASYHEKYDLYHDPYDEHGRAASGHSRAIYNVYGTHNEYILRGHQSVSLHRYPYRSGFSFWSRAGHPGSLPMVT